MKSKGWRKLIEIKSLTDFQTLLISFCLVLFMLPSFTWNYVSIVTPLGLLFIFTSLFIEVAVLKRINIKPFFFAYIVYITYTNIVGISVDRVFINSPLIISLALLLFSYKTLVKSFYKFFYLFSLLILISIGFYLFNILGIYSPVLTEVEGVDGREYLSYPFNVLQVFDQYSPIYLATGFHRFYGALNEPGFIGTLSALILCAFKFDFKHYKALYIYLVAAVLSMSLASYLTLFIGIVFIINSRRVVTFGIPILIILFFQQDLIDRYILKRLEVSDGEIAGNNRTTSEFDERWGNLLNSKDVYFGKGKAQHTTVSEYGISSWKVLVYNYGIVGFALYFSIVLLIYFDIPKKDKYSIIILVVFSLTVYHRPNIHLSHYLIIFISGLLINSGYNIKPDSKITLKQ